MTDKEKAKVILKELDKYIMVNWCNSEFWLAGVMKGLQEIKKQEKKGKV